MASGTITLTSTRDVLEGRIVWSSSSNGSSANSSQVTGDIQVRRNDGYTTTGTWTGHLELGGNVQDFSTYVSVGSSWTSMKSFTITRSHNDDGTGNCYIGGTVNGPSGTSMSGYYVTGGQTVTLDTIPRYATANQSLNSKTVNSIKMNWSSDSTIDYIWYSKDNGSTWTAVGSVNASSGSYTISGLSPNTSYNIKTRVRRKDSQLTTNSSTLSVGTYQIAQISAASDFNHGSNSSITITNPSSAAMSLTMKIGNTTVLTKTPSTGANTISFTDANLDTIYKLYGTANSLTVTYTVSITVNNTTYTNSKTCTITLKGDQKTIRTNVSSSWKRGKLWTNINNTWKRAVVWTNVNGSWKRGI